MRGWLSPGCLQTVARRLRLRPDLFAAVFDPAGDDFFRRNGLLYLDADELSALIDRLAGAQAILGRLWRDPSLRGRFAVAGLPREAGRGTHLPAHPGAHDRQTARCRRR